MALCSTVGAQTPPLLTQRADAVFEWPSASAPSAGWRQGSRTHPSWPGCKFTKDTLVAFFSSWFKSAKKILQIYQKTYQTQTKNLNLTKIFTNECC